MEGADQAQPGPSCSSVSSQRKSARLMKTTKESPEQKQGPCASRWSNGEKKAFLAGLEMYGNYDVEAISKMVGTKNPNQLQAKIQRLKSSMTHAVGTDHVKEVDRLERWFNHLQKIPYNPDASDIIPFVLRMIPHLEDFPDPSEVGIDFKEAYNALADIIEGKPVNVSATTSELFANSIKEMYNVLAHQGGVTCSVQQGQLLKWKTKREEVSMETDQVPEPLDPKDPSFMASLTELNPMNVPLHFLRADASYDLVNPPFARIMMNDWAQNSNDSLKDVCTDE